VFGEGTTPHHDQQRAQTLRWATRGEATASRDQLRTTTRKTLRSTLKFMTTRRGDDLRAALEAAEAARELAEAKACAGPPTDFILVAQSTSSACISLVYACQVLSTA
jgi:hypothetical protein